MYNFNVLIHCIHSFFVGTKRYICLTKTTAAQNEVALSCHKVRGQYFLAVVFVTTIITILHHQM